MDNHSVPGLPPLDTNHPHELEPPQHQQEQAWNPHQPETGHHTPLHENHQASPEQSPYQPAHQPPPTLHPDTSGGFQKPFSPASPQPLRPQPQAIYPSAPLPGPYLRQEPSRGFVTRPRMPRGFLSGSKAYLPEFVLSLWVLAALHSGAIILFSNFLSNLGKDTGSTLGDGFAYSASLSAISMVIVLLPAYYIMYKRLTAREKADPVILTHRWRKGFLGIFLVLIGLALIFTFTGMVFEIVTHLAASGIKGADTGGTAWKTYLKYAFAAALFGFTLWFQGRNYSGKGEA
jgi:hypothetical protein